MGEPTKRQKIECINLNKIQKHLLDFDLIPQCKTCLSKSSIYCCLTCGSYYEGPGENSHAYIHSIEKDHPLYIEIDTECIISLPENCKIFEDLDDIKYNLRPVYNPSTINLLESQIIRKRDLDGKNFIVGLIPLNDINSSSYINIVIYLFSRITEIKNQLLLNNYSGLTQCFGAILKKMWNEKSFKNNICPFELVYMVHQSNKAFDSSLKDPHVFLPWIINQFIREGFLKNIILKKIQGLMAINGKNSKFFYFKLDLPLNSPFHFQSSSVKMQLDELMYSFWARKNIKIIKFPEYLIILIEKIKDTGIIKEKSKFTVDFELKIQILGENFELISVVYADNGTEKKYNILLLHISSWFEIEDIKVVPFVDQLVTKKDPYILLYRKMPK